MATYTNLSGFSVDGVVESSLQGKLLGIVDSLPTASSDLEGCVVLLSTDSRFYKCTSGTWTQIAVADSPDLSAYVLKTTTVNNKALSGNITLDASDVSAVPTTRKVNNKALSADISLSASDVGAVPTDRTVNNKALSSNISLGASDVGAVPTDRTVNGKPLSGNITLGASDVSAIASSYLSTSKPTSSSTDSQVPTSKAVYTAVNEVAGAVTSEATARGNADNNLQSQIDAIVASSDVKDIVGTYAELQAYDTSTLGNNDIIKVLSDSTQSNATTYYRWVITGGTGAWTLIGSEGPYLTPATASSTYVPKTTTVNSKALSGNISLSASDVSAIPSSYLSTATPSASSTDTEVPTAKAVNSALANANGFQVTAESGYYTLTDGNNVTLTNNTTYWTLSWS